MTIDEQLEEWSETRERLAAHLAILRARDIKVYAIGNLAAETVKASIETLAGWQQALDELVIDLLMPGEDQPSDSDRPRLPD